jgi:hypothetical protein
MREGARWQSQLSWVSNVSTQPMIFVSVDYPVNMKIQRVKQPDKNSKKQLINCPPNAYNGILLNGKQQHVLFAPVAQWIEQRFPNSHTHIIKG